MHLPGLRSLVYLFVLLVWMPWMAFQSKRWMTPAPAEADKAAKPIPSRTRVFASTLVSLTLVFLLAWYTGKDFGYPIFAAPPTGARAVLPGAAALAVLFALMSLNRAMRSPEERRTMAVYKLMPRTEREWVLYVVTALAAGVSEEAAYRGVLMSILWYSLGSAWAAAVISATVFSVSHALQGWKTGIVIFLMSLAFQGLVWFTGTLVVAMVVHATYDIVAGVIGARRVRLGLVEG
jgi:membrane protease YdiL (CAAX protease family)